MYSLRVLLIHSKRHVTGVDALHEFVFCVLLRSTSNVGTLECGALRYLYCFGVESHHENVVPRPQYMRSAQNVLIKIQEILSNRILRRRYITNLSRYSIVSLIRPSTPSFYYTNSFGNSQPTISDGGYAKYSVTYTAVFELAHFGSCLLM